MSFCLLFASLLLHSIVFGEAVSVCTPSVHSIITQSENPFDGGAVVSSCEVPITTSVCSGIVDYPVPASIAKLATIIEHHIVVLAGNTSCNNGLIDVMCSQKFPRCEEDGSIVFNSYNCSGRVAELSSMENPECINLQCNNTPSTFPAGTSCRSISQIIGTSGFNFNTCNQIINQSTLVTEWMLEYIKHLDQELSASGSLASHSSCGRGLISHMCNLIGKCTADGENIEFINTRQSCSSAVECYSDDFQTIAASSLSCNLWPQDELRNCLPAPTVATGSSTTPSEAMLTNTPGINGLPTPGNNTFEVFVNSAPISIGQSGLLGISLFFVILVMTVFR